MSKKSLEELFNRKLDKGQVEQLPDNDLMILHSFSKSNTFTNGFRDRNRQAAIPLLTEEIIHRQNLLKGETNDLNKAQDAEKGIPKAHLESLIKSTEVCSNCEEQLKLLTDNQVKFVKDFSAGQMFDPQFGNNAEAWNKAAINELGERAGNDTSLDDVDAPESKEKAQDHDEEPKNTPEMEDKENASFISKGGPGSGRHKEIKKDISNDLTQRLLSEGESLEDNKGVSEKNIVKFLKQFKESNPDISDSEISISDFFEWYDN